MVRLKAPQGLMVLDYVHRDGTVRMPPREPLPADTVPLTTIAVPPQRQPRWSLGPPPAKPRPPPPPVENASHPQAPYTAEVKRSPRSRIDEAHDLPRPSWTNDIRHAQTAARTRPASAINRRPVLARPLVRRPNSARSVDQSMVLEKLLADGMADMTDAERAELERLKEGSRGSAPSASLGMRAESWCDPPGYVLAVEGALPSGTAFLTALPAGGISRLSRASRESHDSRDSRGSRSPSAMRPGACPRSSSGRTSPSRSTSVATSATARASSKRRSELEEAVAAGEALATALEGEPDEDGDQDGAQGDRRTARERATLALEALLAMTAEQYQELTFDVASGEYQFSEAQAKAAAHYDTRHGRLTGNARRQLVNLEYDPTHSAVSSANHSRIQEIRRLRYFVPEPAGGPLRRRVFKIKRRRRPRWTLDKSCWAARLQGNSGDFFETAAAMRTLFDLDWQVAVSSHELAWYIVKCHHDPTSWRDLDQNGTHDEVDEVREACFQHHRLIYGAFDYYATLYSDNENAPGEPDVFNISFNGYMKFAAVSGTDSTGMHRNASECIWCCRSLHQTLPLIATPCRPLPLLATPCHSSPLISTLLAQDCRMVSKRVQHSEFEVIWAIVNAVDKTTASIDKFNKGKYLNRQEFLQCIVRMAIAVYCQRGLIGDVSDAVNQLLVGNLMGNLPAAATQNSNAFRKRFCYLEKTSVILEAHESSLRALYVNVRDGLL